MTDDIDVDIDDGDDDDGLGCWGCLWIVGGFVGLVIGTALVKSFPSVMYTIGLTLGGGVVGGGIGTVYSLPPTTQQYGTTAGKTILGLGGAALVTSLVLMMPLGSSGGDYPSGGTVSGDGGMIGPVSVDRSTWVDVRIGQEIRSGESSVFEHWSFVTVELLGADKQYLSSFGGGLWHYAGYDDGYYWNQSDETYEATLWMPAGTYYLRFKTEANVTASKLEPIHVWMEPTQWWGNPRPLRWLAYGACFLGAMVLAASLLSGSSTKTE